MATKPFSLDTNTPDTNTPQIPLRRMPWFMQLMMIFAVTVLAGIVYGFWQISQVEPAQPDSKNGELSQPAP